MLFMVQNERLELLAAASASIAEHDDFPRQSKKFKETNNNDNGHFVSKYVYILFAIRHETENRFSKWPAAYNRWSQCWWMVLFLNSYATIVKVLLNLSVPFSVLSASLCDLELALVTRFQRLCIYRSYEENQLCGLFVDAWTDRWWSPGRICVQDNKLLNLSTKQQFKQCKIEPFIPC